ncbi:MAG: hypothetical protein AAB562_04200 [Patescibacteria group bacterium]
MDSKLRLFVYRWYHEPLPTADPKYMVAIVHSARSDADAMMRARERFVGEMMGNLEIAAAHEFEVQEHAIEAGLMIEQIEI